MNTDYIRIIIIVIVAAFGSQYLTIEAARTNKWEKYRVVPDVIQTPPSKTAKIQYDCLEVKFGNELAPTQTHQMPSVYWPTKRNSYYTLFMNDPDVPKKIGNEYQHWIVFNIPGTNISEGDTAFDYVGPAPPKKSGLHRYTFLIYKQSGYIPKQEFSDIKQVDSNSRLNFRLADLLQRFEFKNPIAGNFFRAKNEQDH